MSKYSRTYHLTNSPGLQNDDRHQKDISNLIGTQIVILEKLDGENTGIETNGVYARSHATYAVKPWNVLVRQLHNMIGKDIPEDVMLFGENMEGIHSIEYTNLDSFFYLFGVRDKNKFLTWREVEEYSYILDIKLVPILFKGSVESEEELFNLVEDLSSGESKLGGKMEGVVVRVQGSFDQENFQNNVVKWVRKDHVQTDEHWTKNWKRAKINYR